MKTYRLILTASLFVLAAYFLGDSNSNKMLSVECGPRWEKVPCKHPGYTPTVQNTGFSPSWSSWEACNNKEASKKCTGIEEKDCCGGIE